MPERSPDDAPDDVVEHEEPSAVLGRPGRPGLVGQGEMVLLVGTMVGDDGEDRRFPGARMIRVQLQDGQGLQTSTYNLGQLTEMTAEAGEPEDRAQAPAEDRAVRGPRRRYQGG